jgi:hypothetical protein
MPQPTHDSLDRLIDSMSRTIRVNGEPITTRDQHAEFAERNLISGMLFFLAMLELLLLAGTLLMLAKGKDLPTYKAIAAVSAVALLITCYGWIRNEDRLNAIQDALTKKVS